MTTAARLTAVYTVAAIAFAAARGDRRIVAYLAVTGALAAAVAVLHRRRPIGLRLALALSGCGALHLAGGLLPGDPVFYETWLVPHVLKYDQLVHFTVTATITVVAARTLTRRPLVAVALALAAGLGNEAFEYASAAVRLGGLDLQPGAWTNAAWDLVFNAFGAATAGYVVMSTTAWPDTRSPEACASHVAYMSA